MEEDDHHSDIGVLAPLVGYHLRRGYGAFVSDYSEALAGTGMRQVLVGILAVVSNRPGINQGAAGRILGIKRANMVSLINELVSARLLYRVVDAHDRRAFSLTLTDAGQEMLRMSMERIRTAEDVLLSDFSSDQVDQLRQLLEKIERKSAVED